MAVRLPRGWTKLKVIGDVEPVQILVNRDSGKFGTMLVGGEDFQSWDTLPEAEAFVKLMNEAGAIDAMMVDSTFRDEVIRLVPLRVKQLGRAWVRMDGTRLPSFTRLFFPDVAAAEAIERKREQHEDAKRAMIRIRDEAWEIAKSMTILDDGSLGNL